MKWCVERLVAACRCQVAVLVTALQVPIGAYASYYGMKRSGWQGVVEGLESTRAPEVGAEQWQFSQHRGLV